MRSCERLFLLISLLAVPLSCAFGQAQFADLVDPEVSGICAGVRGIPFPRQDRPTPQEAQTLANCSPQNLYFGFGEPADPVKARKCAYLKMDQRAAASRRGRPVRRPPGVADDPGYILMMIYANGKGAPRNLDLALKLACTVGWAPAEFAGRVDHLARLRKEHWTGNDFSICDDITSGYMQGLCAVLDERVKSQERQSKVNAIVDRWSEQDRKAFQALQQTAENFFKTRANNEVDLSGTAHVMLQVEEEASLRDGLLSSLTQFATGRLPQFTAEQFRQADAELNSVYHSLQTAQPDFGTVSSDGVRKTEQAWIEYRDSWVTFGAQKYPHVSAESWKTWLTQARITMLRGLLP